VTGRTIGEEAAQAKETAGQEVVGLCKPMADRRVDDSLRQSRTGRLGLQGVGTSHLRTSARRVSSTARRPRWMPQSQSIKPNDVVVIRYEDRAAGWHAKCFR
jgi:hypothetical protein